MKWQICIVEPTDEVPIEESISGQWGPDLVTIDESTARYQVGDRTITVTTRADVPGGPFITVEGHEPKLPPPFDRYFTVRSVRGTTTVVHDVAVGAYVWDNAESTVTQINEYEREVIIRANTLRAAWTIYLSVLNNKGEYFVTS
jgi:hypothetical protein